MLNAVRRPPDSDGPGRWVSGSLFLWTVIAIVAATTSFIALGATTWQQWLYYVYSMLVYFYTWALLSAGIYGLTGRLRFDGRNGAVAAVAHVGILLAITLILPFMIHPLTWREWLYGDHAVGFHSLNAFIYAFVLVGSLMLRYHRLGRARERDAVAAELRNIGLQRDLSEARVNALRSQINPHFLFNTLNSIASLIETSNNEEAARVTGMLGALLRTALYETGTVFHTLRQELDFLQRYVEIEKVRFGDRFAFQHQVGEDCLEDPVPTLFLQPIVENAVKYAVSPSPATVHVRLQARRQGPALVLTISDDGPGLAQATKPRGVGLSNVRERLALLYGGDAELDVDTNAQGGVTVRIRLPRSLEKNRGEPQSRAGRSGRGALGSLKST